MRVDGAFCPRSGGNSSPSQSLDCGGLHFFCPETSIPHRAGSQGNPRGLAKLRLVPAADAASPGAQALADQQRRPHDGPEAAGDDGQQQVPPVGDPYVGEYRLSPAMGTVGRKPGAFRAGSSTFFRFSLALLHSKGRDGYSTRRRSSMRRITEQRIGLFPANQGGKPFPGQSHAAAMDGRRPRVTRCTRYRNEAGWALIASSRIAPARG